MVIKRMKRASVFCIMLLLTIIYALCFTFIKIGLPFLPPLLFGGLRALLGGITLLLVVCFLKQSLWPTNAEWKWIFWIGITTTITFFGMFLSPGQTGAGIASILGNMSPFFTVLLALCILHEKISKLAKTALCLGVLGLLFIAYPELFGTGAIGIVGIILAVGTSGATAVSNIIVKRMGVTKSIIRISSWQLILGSFPILTVSYVTEKGKILSWNTTSLSILLFLGIVGTAFTTATWYILIQHYNVGKLSLFLFLIPIFGILIASFIFREPMHTNELFAIGLILFATLLLVIDSLKEKSASV